MSPFRPPDTRLDEGSSFRNSGFYTMLFLGFLGFCWISTNSSNVELKNNGRIGRSLLQIVNYFYE